MSDFAKLSIEVNLLKRELRTLREELQTLRVDGPKQAVQAPPSGAKGTQQEGDSSSTMSVEEVA
jgi:hypothetical protein